MKWMSAVFAALALAGCTGQTSMDDVAVALARAAPDMKPVIAVMTETRVALSPRDLVGLTRYFQAACAQIREGRLYDDSIQDFVVGPWPAQQLQLDVLMKTQHNLTDEQAIRIAAAYNEACARTVNTDVSG